MKLNKLNIAKYKNHTKCHSEFNSESIEINRLWDLEINSG